MQFEILHSAVEVSFWYELERKKLVEYKLDSSEKPLVAYYKKGGHYAQLSSKLFLSRDSFYTDASASQPGDVEAHGWLLNLNTIEEFRALDKNKLINDKAKDILNAIKSGEWMREPNRVLTNFLLLTFADLKAHKFHYWFAFPALVPPQPIAAPAASKPIADVFSQQQLMQLRVSVDQFRQQRKSSNRLDDGFFIVAEQISDSSLAVVDLESHFTSLFVQTDANQSATKSYSRLFLAFLDPCALQQQQSNVAGWPLRNFLYAAAFAIQQQQQTPTATCFSGVICMREDQLVSKPTETDADSAAESLSVDSQSIVLQNVTVPVLNAADDAVKVVGWEKNAQGTKPGPRTINLANLMDPKRLAESSVSLNLQLMRWRMFPALNADLLADTRCLLVGSGTLGCHVARNLMAWGFRKISFIDRGRVSFSNPVRQPLFVFEDCLNGGRPKALAAAERLAQIFPSVESTGHDINIAMPGHVVSQAERAEVTENVRRLEELVASHDVIFLLTDSRESRWLPSMFAAKHRKIVINAALGFDSYMVMRHGIYPSASSEDESAKCRLGCYFCNDVVAPADSLRDRTLDQQCTVTRPGVSAIAGALAVELLASLLHHPQRGLAPASSSDTNSDEDGSGLGLVPHQIRGFVSSYQQLMLTGSAYEQCTACSASVLSEYEARGFEFLETVFNDPRVLEEITGLAELQRQAAERIAQLEIDQESVEHVNGGDDDDDDFDLI